MSTTTTYAYTHSVNHVTDRMLQAFKEIIRDIGLEPTHLTDDWEALERGVRTWLETSHLEVLILEIWDPDTDEVVGRWDFNIDYDHPGTEMWADPGAIRSAIEKMGSLPADCLYRVVATTSPGRPDVEGWSSTELRSTDGMTRQGVGTSAAAPGIGADGSYLRRSS